MFDEGLYLLRKYEFVVTKQEIYKFGRSNKILKRIEDYPNGSIVYLLISCKDSILHERKILEIFREKYENKLYHGSETFLGSLDSMKETIINYVSELMMNEGYKIVNQKILVERINEETNKNIPKRMQEIYNAEIINIPGINICHLDQNENILNLKDKEIINIANMDTNRIGIINCNCGFKAINQKEYTNHKIRCTNINNSNCNRVCKYCKKILSNAFSCDRHMLTCKSALNNSNNLIESNLQAINNAIASLKKFIFIFESSNESDKKKIMEGNQYKKEVELLLKYQSDKHINAT